MSVSKISTTSESLVNWLTTSGIKCAITKKRTFLMLAANLLLVNPVQVTPLWKASLKLGWRIISTILWGILFLVILSSLGRSFAFGSTLVPTSVTGTFGVIDSSPVIAVQGEKFTADINAALVSARESALKTASNELDLWIAGLMYRVDAPSQDNDFLDWYFGYWTQQKFGLDGTLQAGKRLFKKKSSNCKGKNSRRGSERIYKPSF